MVSSRSWWERDLSHFCKHGASRARANERQACCHHRGVTEVVWTPTSTVPSPVWGQVWEGQGIPCAVGTRGACLTQCSSSGPSAAPPSGCYHMGSLRSSGLTWCQCCGLVMQLLIPGETLSCGLFSTDATSLAFPCIAHACNPQQGLKTSTVPRVC